MVKKKVRKLENTVPMSMKENETLAVMKKDPPQESISEKLAAFKQDPEMLKRLKSITGMENPDLSLNTLLSTVANSSLPDKGNLAIPAMQELKPQNAIESMLCSQAISLHFVGMDFLNKTNSETALNTAIKLLRLQHETIEALMKLRRNGEQRVIVQHVNVNDGGQAIVGGNMIAGGGGK